MTFDKDFKNITMWDCMKNEQITINNRVEE